MQFGNKNNSRRWFRWRLLFAIILAWGLIIADYQLGSITSNVRNQVSSWVIVPMRFIAQLPTKSWTASSDYFKSRDELILAKRKLEEELLRERVRQKLLIHVEKENEILRRLVDARKKISPEAIIAEIINTASLPFINRIVINKGSQDGIQPGRGVFNDEGVIGRLTRVDPVTSQALLLTDKRFWVATRSRRNNVLVLLQGDGGGKMIIRLVPNDVDLKRGDVLVTAGGAGPFPAGLPVAVIDNVWTPAGVSFMEGIALPLASIRQDSALLVQSVFFPEVPDTKLPVSASGAIPAGLSPDILP